jgi:hypothetical protein
MRYQRSFLFVMACWAWMAAEAQDFAGFRQAFWQQLSESCRPGLRWEKSVTELSGDAGSKTESRTLDLDCRRGWAKSGNDSINLGSEEFAFLFEYAFDNANYAPYMVLSRNGMGVSAKVKPGQEKESKLQLQRFDVDSISGRLQFAETRIWKDSPFYDLKVRISVWFDPSGHYLRHEIETNSDVVLGGELHTVIKARIL